MLFNQILFSFCFIILSSCNRLEFPRDPEETLVKVSGGILKAGYTEDPPHIIDEVGGPKGPQVELVEGFARSLNAKVNWVKKSEQKLFEDLENKKLHIVIGGFSKKTPWKDRVGISRPFRDKENNEHIIAVTNGENAFLVKLEKFFYHALEQPRSGL